MQREPMYSVLHGIRTSDGSFHAPAISGSGTRRLANAYGYLRGTGTPFDPPPGVTISAIFYRLPTTALCGFGKRIWEAETGRCIEVLRGHDECVVNAAWTLDRGSVLSCDSSGGLRAFAVDASSNSGAI